MRFLRPKPEMPTAETALPGRDDYRYRCRNPLRQRPPDPGAVRAGRPADGGVRHGLLLGRGEGLLAAETVWSTAVGYAGGYTPNPTYEEACSGLTGHAEVVLVVFDPDDISYAELLKIFFENHDPTQGMRQGNDVGTQYRSAIYYTSEEQRAAEAAAEAFGKRLADAGYGAITTEIAPLGEFYYAEDYHQQYLAKNPNGYCPVLATGVSCPVGLFAESS